MLKFLFYFSILIFAIIIIIIIIIIILGFSFLFFSFILITFNLKQLTILNKTIDSVKCLRFTRCVDATALFSCVSAAVIGAHRVYVGHKTFTLLPPYRDLWLSSYL